MSYYDNFFILMKYKHEKAAFEEPETKILSMQQRNYFLCIV